MGSSPDCCCPRRRFIFYLFGGIGMVIPFASEGRQIFGGGPELWRWVVIIGCIPVALISYWLIEKPLIDFSHSGMRPLKPSASALARATSRRRWSPSSAP